MGFRLFSAALCAAAVSASAGADVRDVRAARHGDKAVLEIEFDAPLTSAAAAPAPGGVVLQIAGAEAQGTWAPAQRDLLTALEARGGTLTAFTAYDVVSARAVVNGRVARVELTLGGALDAAALAEAAPSADVPAPAPLAAVAEPEPGAGGDEDPVDVAGADAELEADAEPAAPAHPGGARAAELYAVDLDDETCEAADQAVRDDPWNLDQVRVYGACLARAGDHAEAAAVFERLLTFQPDDPEALLGLAVARHRAGDLAGARESYDTALAFAVTDAEAARIRALMDGL